MSNLVKEIGTYKPGSIQRVKLQNFLTYDKVEFFPGPRLNMVVGPNGTGKSTILCAICLGLGGEPKLLGRADDCRLFIQHEKEIAQIEIELTPFFKGGQTTTTTTTHVIKRRIDRSSQGHNGKGGASTFYINDTKVTAKAVKELVTQTYHIAVDNLCTFLPQDRVGNFSGFGPQELLIEMEKSMAGNRHLYTTHQALIAMEAELNEGGNEVETIQSKLKRLEADNERLGREKERMEEREEAGRQLVLLEKKFVWLKFDECRSICQQLKQQKDAARLKVKEAQQQLQPLEEAHANLVTEQQRYEARFKSLEASTKLSMKEMEKQHHKADKHEEELESALTNLNSLDAMQRDQARKMEKLRDKWQQAKQEVADLPSKENVDKAQAQAAAEMRSIRPGYDQAKRQQIRAHETARELSDAVALKTTKLNRMNDVKTQRRERVFQAFPELATITDWVNNNRSMFRRPVHGPVACEVDTKSHNAAAYLEQHVRNATLKSFVVECKEDYDLLYKEVRQGLKQPINIIIVDGGRLAPVSRLYSEAKLRILKEQHGVAGYLDESFEAPPAILQALRSADAVHKVLAGSSKTQVSIDDKGLLDFLSQPDNGGGNLQGYCIFSSKGERSFVYRGNASRYSRTLAIRQDDVKQPRFLQAGVNPERKAELEGEIEKLNSEFKAAQERNHELMAHLGDLQKQAQEAKARLEHAKQAQQEVAKAHTKMRTAQSKLEEAEQDAVVDNEGVKDKIMQELKARLKGALSALEAGAALQAKTMQSTFSFAGVRINQDVVAVAERKARDAFTEAQRDHAEIERQAKKIKDEFESRKGEMRHLKALAEEKAPLHDDDGDELPLKAELDSLAASTLPETEAAMEEAKAKLNGIEANPEAIRQYQELQREMELVRSQLEMLTETKDSKLHDLDARRRPWEEALQNAASKVNCKFSDYMAELGCAGDVRLMRGEDDVNGSGADAPPRNFKDWGIQIRVKFREKSSLQALSARVQSGGERSVSTIMFLMALQDLMVSPFRCVDEINQGLDERNERLVFKRIVENSTKPPSRHDLTDHSGQYFLITPKLLPNLYDMEVEAMTVLCIFNGPHNFEDPLAWQPDRFVEAAKRAASKDQDPATAVDENDFSGVNSKPEEVGPSPPKRRRQS